MNRRVVLETIERGVHGQGSVSDFVRFVEHWTDHPLVDRTGLNGLFRFETEGWLPVTIPGQGLSPWNRWEDGRLISQVPTVFEVFNKLGLDLKPAKGEVPVIIVENVHRPTPYHRASTRSDLRTSLPQMRLAVAAKAARAMPAVWKHPGT